MCGICGCNEPNKHQHHSHDAHTHSEDESFIIDVEKNIFAKNNEFALSNRHYFLKKNITSFNFMSSPGSGKTTLLTKTIIDLKNKLDIAVIVGDQQTDYDAQQLKISGAEVIQVNTGKMCHLDAHMVGHAATSLDLPEKTLLFIENVGNLVCPAMFDLGEMYKIVILSVTEGENKPLKYPDMFRFADVLIVTKTDLLPYVKFDLDNCIKYAKQINPTVEVLKLSATSEEGLNNWYDWLKNAKPR